MIAIPVVTLLIGGSAAGYWLTRDEDDDEVSSIAAASPTETIATPVSSPMAPMPTPTATLGGLVLSGPAMTETAEAGATATVGARRTATAAVRQARAEEGRTLAERAALEGSRVAGPTDGTLPHERDGAWEGREAGVSLADFRLDVSFVNPPADAEDQAWDAGLLFRHTDDERTYGIAIASDGRWRFYQGRTQVEEGRLNALDTAAGAVNRVQLVAAGTTAYLYVNDRYIAVFDVSAMTDPGTIWVATDLLVSSESGEHPMEFRDFTVWSIAP
jgi:hypothetical protein